MKVISLCGVDGSGKTTLIQKISPTEKITTLRCPQYFESGEHTFNRLAQKLEDAGKVADEHQNVPLKAVILFLQISMYGNIEKDHRARNKDAKIFIRERDPLIDTLVYSPLYTQVLGPHSPSIPGGLAEDAEFIEYLNLLHRTLPLGFDTLNTTNLSPYILRFFRSPAEILIENCQKLFQASIANQIVLIQMSPALLSERLSLKAKQNTKEHHEDPQLLLKLQQGMAIVANQLKTTLGWEIKTFSLDHANQNDFASDFMNWTETQS